MNSFQDNLKTAFSAQIDTLVMENKQTHPAYRQLERDYSRLFETVRGQLDKKHRRMMLRMEAKRNEIDGIEKGWIYLQGMIDCVTLLKTIKLL